MRTIIGKEHGRVDVLIGFVIVVVVLVFAIYEVLVKEHETQPASTQSRPKTLIDGVRDKVNDAMDKEMSRIPADEPTQPATQ
jgi:F0F1-type ATP synthase membrane subunit a